jgi:hypothetical protein
LAKSFWEYINGKLSAVRVSHTPSLGNPIEIGLSKIFSPEAKGNKQSGPVQKEKRGDFSVCLSIYEIAWL